MILLNTINEKLEEISNGTYATDSVVDISNWLLNKPKPYRIVYDNKFDIWMIADATKNTHRDMAIDLIDSDTLFALDYIKDSDIDGMRKRCKFNDGWTDAEAYADCGFDYEEFLAGLFFIPDNYKYSDYEESGFYKETVKITTGTIFARNNREFTADGHFKDLYIKLKRLGAIIG